MHSQQDTIGLHEEPVKSWLINTLMSCGEAGLSVHDQNIQDEMRKIFFDDTLTLEILCEELYQQGIVSIRGLEWAYLSKSIHHLLSRCIEENRPPTW